MIGLIALALVILIGAYILRPFFAKARQPEDGPTTPPDRSVLRQRAALIAERNALYRRIKTLEFEHKTNKLSTEMFEEQRHALVAQAVDVLQRLDALPTPAEDPVEDALLARRESTSGE